ncbi:sugar ABC transporter substrate-binding protein [Christensenella timonensis]|uniref:sugar ABC transporter substrate-binding protein n=1 Tax=Christensenella timonensis TaxID=1816678 RepID=UPI00082AD4F4|nr:sugar ABC transporter substrate-binding protein [Christensenella timonensis]
MKKVLVLVLAVAMAVTAFVGCAAPAAQESSAAPSESAAAPSESAAASEGAESAAPAADGDITIGLTLMDYNFPFFQDMLAAAKKEAEAQGVKLIDLDGAGDVQKQLEGVEDMISGTKVNALILNPVDSAAISPATLEANAAGIPVVTVDVRSEQGDVVAHVASNNMDIGREAGKYAVELLKERNGSEKGKVLIIGYPQITSISDRAAGFQEIMEQYPDIEVVEQDPTNLNVQEAQTLMENLTQTYPEGTLDIVYGANATNAVGVISATEAAGRTDYDIIGVDDDPEILNAISKNGVTAATVVQAPIEMGKLAVQIAVKAAKGETIDESEVATPLTVVTRETYADFMKTYEQNQKDIEAYK